MPMLHIITHHISLSITFPFSLHFRVFFRKPIMEKVSSRVHAFLEDFSVPDIYVQSWVVTCKSWHKGSAAGVNPFASVSGVCHHPGPDLVWCPVVGRTKLSLHQQRWWEWMLCGVCFCIWVRTFLALSMSDNTRGCCHWWCKFSSS